MRDAADPKVVSQSRVGTAIQIWLELEDKALVRQTRCDNALAGSFSFTTLHLKAGAGTVFTMDRIDSTSQIRELAWSIS